MSKEEEVIERIHKAVEESKKTNKLVLEDIGEIPCDVVKEEIAMKVIARQATTLPNLEELHIIGCKVKSAGFRFVAAGLKGNTKIKTVNISEAGLDDSAARDLALVLKANKTITTLCISGNDFTHNGIKLILTAVKDSKVLETLALDGNTLEDKGCEHIGEMLTSNTSLKALHMQNCNVHSHGLFVIAQALKFNKTLQRLDLSQNNFGGNYGMENLGLSLKDNTSLQVLNISNNSIGDDAAAAIFMGLARNTSVVSFAMGGALVEESEEKPSKSVAEMAGMIKANKTLKHLSVFSYVFRNPGLKLIANALKENNTIEELVISGNDFDNDGAKYLLEALDVNKTLLSVHLTRDDNARAAEITNNKEIDSDSDSESDDDDDASIITDDMFMAIKTKLQSRKKW